MIFISYYTKKTPYETVMKTYLLPSLIKWGLKYDIEAIEDLGNWNLNTSYKPKFILRMLNKHQEDICFLDSDVTIEKSPTLLMNIPIDVDIAVHFFDWFLHWRKQSGNSKRELLSGTMVIKYKPRVKLLLERYIHECKIEPLMWEQKILQKILENMPNISIYKLPAEYCCVKMQDGSIPHYLKKEDVVILHHQKSREFRNWKRK